MTDLKIISLNVKRLNNVVKRQKIISFLKKEKHKLVAAILIHRNLPLTIEKVIKDKEGRYILISGFLFRESVFIGCVYGPNSEDVSFFPNLLTHVSAIASPYLVLGGDFNCVPDPRVDKSPPGGELSPKSIRLIEFCSDLEICDSWRVAHPTDRDFTFFSCHHQSFSRIDLLLSSRTVLDRMEECSIRSCPLSDYSDESLFIEYITKEWNVFMTTNKTEDVSPSLLWETAKAYLRGSIISYTTAQKKASMKEQLSLEHIIQKLEVQFKISRSKTILKKLEAARSALNQLLTKRAKAAIFFDKHKL
uniref:Endonuclease/exonuclease/phosphatase domain-containing protein n=1 Tax=Haplochromis burtoni TaxID=8153 RepID=A0A3Q2WJ08_HAPBU